jgi:Co/Zn/Cd efflux system component
VCVYEGACLRVLMLVLVCVFYVCARVRRVCVLTYCELLGVGVGAEVVCFLALYLVNSSSHEHRSGVLLMSKSLCSS